MSQNIVKEDPFKESGYNTDFEATIFSKMPVKEENLFQECFYNDDNLVSSAVNLTKDANDFIDQPMPSNTFYPNLLSFETQFHNHKVSLRNLLKHQIDQVHRMEVFEEINSNNVQSNDLCEYYSSNDNRSVSPDIFCESSEDELIHDDSENFELNKTLTPKLKTNKELVLHIEEYMIALLKTLAAEGNATILITKCEKWENCTFTNDILTFQQPSCAIDRKVDVKHIKCRYHFTIIMYILSEIYHLLITNTTCTERELYYNDTELTESQATIKSAIKDICIVLRASPWELGIRPSTKGLIAGAIKIHMTNVVIDCCINGSSTLIPIDMQDITFIETTAKYVVIIEKHTIFEKLLNRNILVNLNNDVILITGKGFPDINTRLIVKRLFDDFHLPIYILTDADPFGIEIMLVYRFGSKAMVLNSDYLACPQIRWIGIQPSEVDMLAIPTQAQSREDKKRIIDLLKRPYINADIRNELEILKRLERKAEIEGVANFSLNFLVSDYIPNKIKQNLVI